LEVRWRVKTKERKRSEGGGLRKNRKQCKERDRIEKRNELTVRVQRPVGGKRYG